MQNWRFSDDLEDAFVDPSNRLEEKKQSKPPPEKVVIMDGDSSYDSEDSKSV